MPEADGVNIQWKGQLQAIGVLHIWKGQGNGQAGERKASASSAVPQSEGDWWVGEVPKPHCLLFLALLRGRKALSACLGPPFLWALSAAPWKSLCTVTWQREGNTDAMDRVLAESAAEPSWASRSPNAKPPLIHLDGGDRIVQSSNLPNYKTGQILDLKNSRRYLCDSGSMFKCFKPSVRSDRWSLLSFTWCSGVGAVESWWAGERSLPPWRAACSLPCAWCGVRAAIGLLWTWSQKYEKRLFWPHSWPHVGRALMSWTLEGKWAGWEGRTERAAGAKCLLTWGRSLVMGVELRASRKTSRDCHRSCCPGNRNCVDGSEQNHRQDLKGLNFLENLQHNN